MSLSSKLHGFRKELKRKKEAIVLQDEEIQAIARHMPRDADSLGKFLSSDQIEAFGDRVLEITQAHKRDQTKFEDCILEMGAFVRGGMPGMRCLNRVYTRILHHFRVGDDVDEVFSVLKLYVNHHRNTLERKGVDSDGEEEDFPSQKKAKFCV